MTTISGILANGLATGALYALVAVGLVLVYMKSRALNFANAEVGMFGAFVFYVLSVEQEWPYLVAVACGIVTSAILGALTYLALYRRRDDPLMMLIGTLGVAGVVLWVASEIWGLEPRFVEPPVASLEVDIGGFYLTGPRVLALVVAIALGVIGFAIFRYTQAGLLFRASAADSYTAQLMGVNVMLIDVATWALAGALAALAGILIAPLVGFHVFFMTLMAVRGFAAALLGGMANVGAALIAGLGVGVVESILSWATSARPGVPDAALVIIIITILVFRPVQLARRTA